LLIYKDKKYNAIKKREKEEDLFFLLQQVFGRCEIHSAKCIYLQRYFLPGCCLSHKYEKHLPLL